MHESTITVDDRKLLRQHRLQALRTDAALHSRHSRLRALARAGCGIATVDMPNDLVPVRQKLSANHRS